MRMPRVMVSASPPVLGSAERLAEAARMGFEWRRRQGFRREWELSSGETCFATFRPSSWRGRRFTATWASGALDLRGGFAGRAAVYQHEGSEQPIARFRPGWFFGGQIELAAGERLLFRHSGVWRARWEVTTEDGIVLISHRTRTAWFRGREATVEVEEGARRHPQLPALLTLAWHRILSARPHAH